MSTFWNLLDWPEITAAGLDSLAMLGGALCFILLLGLPLGIVLHLFARRQLLASARAYALLSFVVNIVRSVPFIILLILMMPLTTLLTGTAIGIKGVIPPLVAGGVPFFARLVESALREVDRGVVEAAQAMGATPLQIICQVLLPEALPGLLAAATVTAIALVDYSAMSGAIGGGGLGDMAIRYGYQRYETEVMLVTVALLIVLVQALQIAGNRLVIHFTRR